jgi:Ni,Fe-hydrogenase I large subunit
VIDQGKIATYQVVTPAAWNIGPLDATMVHGPQERATWPAPAISASSAPCIPTMARPAVKCRRFASAK